MNFFKPTLETLAVTLAALWMVWGFTIIFPGTLEGFFRHTKDWGISPNNDWYCHRHHTFKDMWYCEQNSYR